MTMKVFLMQAPWISMTFVFCNFQVTPVSRIPCLRKCETRKRYTNPGTEGHFIPSDLIAASLKSPLAPPCWSWSRFLWQLLGSENMERHLWFGDRKAFMISRQRCIYSGTSSSCDSLPPLPPQNLPSREEKKIQGFIDLGRHDQHCQPDFYMKRVWINIRGQSCQILSTLDEFWQRNLCLRERGQERQLTCFVTMKNIFLFKHLGKKILLFENLSSWLSFWLVLEICLAKLI